MSIASPKIDVQIARETGDQELASVNSINALTLHKSISERIGTMSITLSSKYADNLIADMSPNDLVQVFINEKLVMEGVAAKPTMTGQMQETGKAKKATVLNGFDSGYLFEHINRPYVDPMILEHYSAQKTLLEKFATIYANNRTIDGYIKDLYPKMLEGIKIYANNQEYEFSDGKKLSERYSESNILETVASSSEFLHNLSIQVQLMQKNQSVFDVITSIADAGFHEIFGDTYDKDDKLMLGSSEKTINNAGYKIVVRPKTFDSTSTDSQYSNFSDNIVVDIGGRHFQYSMMKDAKQIYTAFIVGLAGYKYDADRAAALGGVQVNTDTMKKYGYKMLKYNVNCLGIQDNETDLKQQSTNLSKIMKDWYEDADQWLSGQISTPYNEELKIGKNVMFKLPNDSNVYKAYIEQLDTKFSAEEHRLYHVITYTRGIIEESTTEETPRN